MYFPALLIASLFESCFTQGSKEIIQKCCQDGQYFDEMEQICMEMKYNTNLDFSDLLVYNSDRSEARKTVKDTFSFISNDTFLETCWDIDLIGMKPWLTETGILYLENPNAYHRWHPMSIKKYCLEYKVSDSKDPNAIPVPHFWIAYDDVRQPDLSRDNYETIGLLISCVFLMLVLVVYSFLKYLQNINGMILMAYTSSLLIAFLLLATIKMSTYNSQLCIGLTALIYFFFLASFCWMNVMSYDIWKTFRGYVSARHASNKGQKLKFQVYCAYAWGVPFIMTIVLIILNQSDMSNAPWFITPKISESGCFIRGYEKLLYLYVPMLLLIVCNWVFYLMTAYNLWSLQRDTSVLGLHYTGNKATRNNHKKRFLVYIYLSVVMGLNWIFEILSFFAPNLTVWYITDACNALIGPMLFIIFICKKKVFRNLKANYISIKGAKPLSEKNNTSEELLINSEVTMQNKYRSILKHEHLLQT